MYYYSSIENTFFPDELKQDYINAGSFPDDVIEVGDDIWLEFASNPPPEGKMRIAGSNGLPAWGDVPPPTREELCLQAEVKKKKLMEYATNIISPLQDAVELDIYIDEEKYLLNEWRKYRVELNRIDCSIAPKIEWPEQPKIK
ncbi:tail fiber assembly protein [Xenorhabdus stockiae]|uniref:tail fiber assembly protein n=1 Tax=Xenorhabdus stockiae TaxID=351614 RepID=UPI004062EB42